MVYCAVTEKKFKESLAMAKDSISCASYEEAESHIQTAKETMDNLFPPQNLPEQIEYLNLREKSYRELVELSLSLKTPPPERCADELEKLAEQARRLGERLSQPAEKSEGIEGIVSSLQNCADELEKLTKDYKTKIVEEFIHEVYEPFSGILRILGIEPTQEKDYKNTQSLAGDIMRAREKLRSLLIG